MSRRNGFRKNSIPNVHRMAAMPALRFPLVMATDVCATDSRRCSLIPFVHSASQVYLGEINAVSQNTSSKISGKIVQLKKGTILITPVPKAIVVRQISTVTPCGFEEGILFYVPLLHARSMALFPDKGGADCVFPFCFRGLILECSSEIHA